MPSIVFTVAAAALIAVVGVASSAFAEDRWSLDDNQRVRLIMPIMSPERGKKLFVDKGCIACHAVNGVGGHDAPPMDDHVKREYMNPFDFAARMWNHAPAMIAAQEDALGDQIHFTGQELADITAFVHDDGAQHGFTEKDLTPKARKMMRHEHGGQEPQDKHAEEIGHGHGPPKLGHSHAPGTAPHKD